MKATELSIGDWIWLSDDIYVKVEQVAKRKIGFRFEDNDNKMYYARLCDIDRVPITPEILEASGFVKESKYSVWVYKEKGIEVRIPLDGYPAFIKNVSYDTVKCNITYVHELQHVLRHCHIKIDLKL